MKHDSELLKEVTIDHVIVDGGDFFLARPADIDRLIDSGVGLDDLGHNLKMPYWASLWPVSRVLTARVLRNPDLFRGKRVLELGCGLGLTGLAALRCGADLTFSDYDENALIFARFNAEKNGFSGAKTLRMDWKFPADMTFDVILGSDLAWSPDVVPDLVRAMDHMLSSTGIVWLADQNRLARDTFKNLLQASNLKIGQDEPLPLKESWGWNIEGTFYELQRIAQ